MISILNRLVNDLPLKGSKCDLGEGGHSYKGKETSQNICLLVKNVHCFLLPVSELKHFSYITVMYYYY